MSDETVVPIPPTDTAEIVIVTQTEYDALTTTIATQAAQLEALRASVPLTYDQLISMQEAMQLAWDGFGTRYQSDQTAARMQRLDNWIGEMLTQMRGGE